MIGQREANQFKVVKKTKKSVGKDSDAAAVTLQRSVVGHLPGNDLFSSLNKVYKNVN